MEKVDDVGLALLKVMEANNMQADYGALFDWVKSIAHSVVIQYPGQVGPQGAMGPQGTPGRDGNDAYDKYRWNFAEESLVEFSWKGIAFKAPVPRAWAAEIPQGELNFGDVALIQMLYGSSLVERIATFWRREYDSREDMSLFITEEDLCRLKDIHQSSSYPDHFPVSWAKRFRQSAMESQPGT